MTFKEQKDRYLKELENKEIDRSKKGHVDKAIKPLLDVINSKDGFYSTSSCAGRIVLFVEPTTGRKDHAKWLHVSHDEVTYEELLPAIQKIKETNERVFFRQESSILHVCCDSLESAETLINAAKETGFKRSGIMGIKKRIMLEIMSTEKLDVPIADKGKLLTTHDYIKILIDVANERLRRTRNKIEKLKTRLN